MTLKKTFTPLAFQLTLAAGGISLMPFNLLQFSLPHAGKLITLSDISSNILTPTQQLWVYPLASIMLLFIAIHIIYSAKFIVEFIMWIKEGHGYQKLLSNPYENERIFAFICSLSMSANVIWASLGFFLPQISNNVQALMLPSLVYYLFLWLLLLNWEFKILIQWFSTPIDTDKFHFTWLLDILAFGLVSLTGSGIASMANNKEIASVAAISSLLTISLGLILMVFKTFCLFRSHLKNHKLPSDGLLPALFLMIPLSCLFGLSSFRMTAYVSNLLELNLKGFSFLTVVPPYVLAITWAVLCIFLLKDYLAKRFIRSSFAPPQWAMI